jgi:hypothetical protein
VKQQFAPENLIDEAHRPLALRGVAPTRAVNRSTVRIGEAREFESLWHALEHDARPCTSVAHAAQRYADGFYRLFAQSTVLVRVFGTFRYGCLPEYEQDLVREIAMRAASEDLLSDDTDVLTLLGTRGMRSQWNERTASREHRVVPLQSAGFVGEIPMIARVLSETGFAPFGTPRIRSQYVVRAGAGGEGLFFVGDARVTTDERGRLIVPAVDFVTEHGIRTVFGFGGPYRSARNFVTTIVFCRETISRTTAANFITLGHRFRTQTESLLAAGAVFEPAAQSG